ncbi:MULTISPECIES: multicopper oxidase domain-containing protein [Rhodomicrobium]|uniref:multicopper oxidase family protein n=1 Tax=Rhodomicrobium TaxID=1068 RepID=UPI000B4A85AF|nr:MULTISPECIES: multicopper oxidase domain-containing protein [Rhodomicrobium]
MYLPKSAPKNRLREAQKARENRAEIIRALGSGQVTRRDLFKMGIFTAGGMLALKNGLSPFAPSAYGAIPVGTPPSPRFGAQPFTQEMQRLNLHHPHPLTHLNVGGEIEAAFPSALGERNSKRLSWHTDFTATGGADYLNPRTLRGPCEGRPPGMWFGHQRWNDYLPKVGYQLSLGQIQDGLKFHPNFQPQDPNSVWSYGAGGLGTRGTLPPPLIKIRYGEPVLARVYNSLPLDRAHNNGFGRNEIALHNHNAHNGAGSDGANNAHFFPGQFYDYHWGTCLARSDTYNLDGSDLRASGIDDNGVPFAIPGDFRELQGTLWAHDHRFFFTAENVYKGNLAMLNYYSGPDRGHEGMDDGINLRLPSGERLPWGNIDFDVNLIITDAAFAPSGQLFFDIFDTDGFLGDIMCVNGAYAPFFKVMRRKYRFRIVNGCMSRFIKLVLVNEAGTAVPVTVIANDGNLLVNPVTVNALDPQGTGERFDIIVDFSPFAAGDKLRLVNHIEHEDGRGPKEILSVKEGVRRDSDDPGVGPLLQFRVVKSVESVDQPGYVYPNNAPDRSQVPPVLTEQIPIVEPVRTRHLEFKRTSNNFEGCFPDCGDREIFPWVIRIDGEDQHYMNANRASLIVPRAGEVEHWTLENGGGGWDHPVHLHFEEGVTISRTVGAFGATERLARKDVWRLGEGGKVKIQIRFSEFAGAYVTHCHNTVHEDFAMLMRYQILKDDNGTGDPFIAISPTPNPREDGVEYLTPEILPEGDPRRRGGSA